MSDAPAPNAPAPAATPPAAPPPATPPAAASRPEGIPDNLWTDTGFNAEEFGKWRAPPADLPAAADAYQLPTIEGVEFNAEDPLIPILRTRAFENGIGQEGFSAIVTDYIGKLKELDDQAYTAGLAAIGDNAEGRVRNVSTWLDGRLPADEASALKGLTTDPKAMLGLERLMNAGVQAAPPVPPPPTPTRKTRDEIRTLMNSPAYSGKPRERDQKVIDEVTAWFAEEAQLKAAAQAPKA